jgi:hypothetical protein
MTASRTGGGAFRAPESRRTAAAPFRVQRRRIPSSNIEKRVAQADRRSAGKWIFQ